MRYILQAISVILISFSKVLAPWFSFRVRSQILENFKIYAFVMAPQHCRSENPNYSNYHCYVFHPDPTQSTSYEILNFNSLGDIFLLVGISVAAAFLVIILSLFLLQVFWLKNFPSRHRIRGQNRPNPNATTTNRMREVPVRDPPPNDLPPKYTELEQPPEYNEIDNRNENQPNN